MKSLQNRLQLPALFWRKEYARIVLSWNKVKCPISAGNLNFLLCSENFRRGLCWRHCKFKEWVSFFLGSLEMNRSAEQKNRVNCDLFSRFMGNESQCGTNKSHENRFERHSFLKKNTFSIYTWIYISFTCCRERLNLITSKTKKEGGTRGFVPLLLDWTSSQISLNIWSYFVV